MASLTQTNRPLAVETPLGPDALVLTSFTGKEELGRLFEFELEMISEDHNISFEKIIGENVTLRLDNTRGESRYFNGFVSRFIQNPSDKRYATYRALVVPWFWFLTRSSDCRIFQNKTIPEIIQEVFRERGFDGHFENRLSGNYESWEFCVQYRETDFSFVSRLMEQEGIYYYFKHENGKHILVMVDSTDGHDPFPGYENVTFHPGNAVDKAQEHIRDWTLGKELLSGAYVHTDFDFKKPKKNLRTDPAIVVREHGQSKWELFDFPGEFEELSDGKRLAEVRIQEVQSRHSLLFGSGDTRGLAAGCLFTLRDLPREDQNQKYLVVSVTHHVDGGDYQSGRSSSYADFYSCSFTVMPAKEHFRPARITPKPMIQGPQTAMVAGPSGEEIYTDEFGRVKLKFHWDRYSKGNEKSSCWIRVAQSWAGKKWGAMYIPRIGQEVIVEFLEGDPDLPIITGRVYNGESMPPYNLPDDKTKSTIKSNSSKGGGGFNELRFEDKKGSEELFIHAEKDEKVVVKNNHSESIGNNRNDTVGNNETRKVGKNRERQVGKNETVIIAANREMTVGENHSEKIGANQNITVGLNKVESIMIANALNVGAGYSILVGGAMSTAVGGAMNTAVGLAQFEEVGLEKRVNVGKNLTVTVADKIELITGSAKITMEKSGKIEVSGIDITLKSGAGKINIDAGGIITVKGPMVKINT